MDFGHLRNLFANEVSDIEGRDTDLTSECNSTSCYRYYSDATAPYLIDSWPDIDFDVGEMYAGSVPIDESDPDRTLYFIFKPATEEPVDEG